MREVSLRAERGNLIKNYLYSKINFTLLDFHACGKQGEGIFHTKIFLFYEIATLRSQ